MSQGWRTTPLPGNWSTLRYQVLVRDHYTCQLEYVGCQGLASEVDHIGHNSDHSLPNLRATCTSCHAKRTAAQANTARQVKYGKKKRTEPHPGRPGG